MQWRSYLAPVLLLFLLMTMLLVRQSPGADVLRAQLVRGDGFNYACLNWAGVCFGMALGQKAVPVERSLHLGCRSILVLLGWLVTEGVHHQYSCFVAIALDLLR